jgi:hypothetical protein
MTQPPVSFEVQTDHQIVALGPDRMELRDNADGATLATATRPGLGSPWQVDINLDGAADFGPVATRADAINHMIFDRPDVDPSQPGYSTLVPHGLAEAP